MPGYGLQSVYLSVCPSVSHDILQHSDNWMIKNSRVAQFYAVLSETGPYGVMPSDWVLTAHNVSVVSATPRSSTVVVTVSGISEQRRVLRTW